MFIWNVLIDMLIASIHEYNVFFFYIFYCCENSSFSLKKRSLADQCVFSSKSCVWSQNVMGLCWPIQFKSNILNYTSSTQSDGICPETEIIPASMNANTTHTDFKCILLMKFFAFPSNFPNFLNSAIICNLNAVNAKHFACIHVFHIIWPYHACAQNAKAIFVGLAAFKICSQRAETIIYRDLWIRFEQHCDNWFNWRAN